MAMEDKPMLEFRDRDEMNIIGLMIGRIIERNLSNSKGAAQARKLKGRLGVQAGRMSLTLDFEGGRVVVLRGLEGPVKASIKGSLSSLMHISLGKGPIRAFLAGEVSIRGNPFFAFKALPLVLADNTWKKGQ